MLELLVVPQFHPADKVCTAVSCASRETNLERESCAPTVAGAPATGSVTFFLNQVAIGESTAVDELWKRYFPRMIALARKTLSGRTTGGSGADDAAQSAFISLWQRLAGGQLPSEPNRDGLWRLLATITVRKALKHSERERTAKRGRGRVLGEHQLAELSDDEGTPFSLEQIAGRLPTHEFDLHCAELLLKLSDELREIAVLRLMGYSTLEIAEQLGCTQRKVQRKLELVCLKWKDDVGNSSAC